MWTCPKCKRSFKKANQSHSCILITEESLFIKRSPELKELYDKIVMEVNEMLNLNIATMGKYDWVRGLTPSGHIQSQYLIFEVSRVQADSLRKVHTVRWYK